jgi:hypothetical protein
MGVGANHRMQQHGWSTSTPKQLSNMRLLEMAPENQMLPLPARAISGSLLFSSKHRKVVGQYSSL